MKIRKGDTVVVIRGEDKGKTGKVLSVEIRKRLVYVQRVRLVERHQKPRGTSGPSSQGITEKESPIPISNVALVDPKTNRPTRIRMSEPSGGEDRADRRRSKVRIAVRSGVEIERPTS